MANVLIVEDDPILRDAYNIVFSQRGHTVHTANDGEEGLALCKVNVFDLIILDVMMPVLNGFQFLKAFDPKSHPQTKVVVVTNLTGPETGAEAKKLGAAMTLVKAKLSPEQLAQQVEAAISEA